MPTIYTTVSAASSTRIRIDKPAPKKSAPRTRDELKEKKEKREFRQAAIDEEELADLYDMKPRYFLDIFFQGGARMVHHQEKINPYNAFKSEKAAEAREQGLAKNVPQLHMDHIDEYNALTDEEKDALVERFRDIRSRNFALRRDTPRAKIQDVANIVRNMKMLMAALGNRVGIEGFFCVVRNSAEFHMAPEWYFTSPELEAYMAIATRRKWDTGEVGIELEAFAVAGYLLRTSKQKADWMKAEIRELVSKNLVEVSKVPNATMAYMWHEEDVVQKYNVVLEGWKGRFVNPSELSTSLLALRALVDALKDGTCTFRRLLPAEAQARKTAWEAEVAAGRTIAKSRAQRSDTGVPRKRACSNGDKENSSHTDENDTADDNNPSERAPNAPPPKKRMRKTNMATSGTSGLKPAAKRAVINGRAPAKRGRDDATTKAVLDKLVTARKAAKSRPIISDTEDDDSAGAPGNAHLPGTSSSVPIVPTVSAAPV
ncbi:hypothetical protein C8J57DRAFT_1526695 [Mycena rebaudengoi]|nr:hypothetical protein C8J57DRAFT_1526695 [Mycena rebaudengoi]